MSQQSKYSIEEKVYESNNSVVYRARRISDDRAVILKCLRPAYPSPEKIAWFQREYELTKSVHTHVPGVIEPIEFYQELHQWVIAFEDIGGSSLTHLKVSGALSIEEFLKLAIHMSQIVHQIHHHKVIHKDINPSNFVYHSDTQTLKLIDFGISTQLSTETTQFQNIEHLEGTIAYMAPEQTGRMNRALDARSDLYSLGVTFYELLTGQLPFQSSDLLELIHQHIAHTPLAAHSVRADIPLMLSSIVSRLLEKNAEDRYQSAIGLQIDLEVCLQQWIEHQHIDDFTLGEKDQTEYLQMPQRRIGRDIEVQHLLSIFEQVRNGTQILLTVTGYAGIGKSALVHEVYKPLTQYRGWFISGKFDQFQRTTPYVAWIEALRGLIRHWLSEPEAKLALWRSEVQAALGSSGRLITSILPELEWVIGPQPEVVELPPLEARNRFQFIFQNFVKVWSSKEHPIVLFLDDMQWADSASLSLIENVLSTPGYEGLFIICAYRDYEISVGHPWMLTLESLEKSGVQVEKIHLQPWDISNVIDWCVEAFKSSREHVASLAKLVHKKTNGTPFFVIEFVKALYAKKALYWQPSSHQLKGQWQWNLDVIEAEKSTDNVVDLLTGKVQLLPETTQKILQHSACIGNRFSLQILSVVSDMTVREVARHLWFALEVGLVVPLSNNYKVVEFETHSETTPIDVEYVFAHDRVQQAVYTMIHEETRQKLHKEIGLQLSEKWSKDRADVQLFEIVHHLNQGSTWLTDTQQKSQLSEWNFWAGTQAKKSTAYSASYEYLIAAWNLANDRIIDEKKENFVESSLWLHRYEWTLHLGEEAAEVAYLKGDYESMNAWVQAVLQHAQNTIDSVRAYETKLFALQAQGRYVDAIREALLLLQKLGVFFPKTISTFSMIVAVLQTRLVLMWKTIDSLEKLPVMVDRRASAISRIFAGISGACYLSSPNLFMLLVLKAIRVCVRFGNTPYTSASAYSAYGLLLCAVFGQIEHGYRFGQLALKVANIVQSTEDRVRAIFNYEFFVRHSKEHLSNTLQPLLKGYQEGLEVGNFEFAGYCILAYCDHLFFTGHELHKLDEIARVHTQTCIQLKQPSIVQFLQLIHQVVLNLIGQAESSVMVLTGTVLREEIIEPLYKEEKNINALNAFYMDKAFLAYHFGEVALAHQYIELSEQYAEASIGSYFRTWTIFYAALIPLALAASLPASSGKKNMLLKQSRRYQKKIKLWAKHAPMNHAHRWHLVEAERLRICNDFTHAREHYDQAIYLAHKHNFLSEEALAYELAARFYLNCELIHFSVPLMQQARYLYSQWGALAKVKELDTRYPQLLLSPSSSSSTQFSTISTTQNTTKKESSVPIDVMSVIQTAQTLSAQISLDTLRSYLMKIVLTNAGAQRAVLLIERNEAWYIEAENSIHQEDEGSFSSVLADETSVPMSIVHYIARSRQSVVLGRATQEGEFTRDSYILVNEIASILAVPLLHQGRLVGVLYLEHSSAQNAFPPERVQTVSLLASQAAIAMENAQLYASVQATNESLEETVAVRTAELQKTLSELWGEMDLARKIQTILLPQKLKIHGYDAAAWMQPASQVGGDYYDVFHAGNHDWVLVGDVSGHGVHAGLCMMIAHTAVRSVATALESSAQLLTPAYLLPLVNHVLRHDFGPMGYGLYMTVVALQFANNEIIYSGLHLDLLVYRASTQTVEVIPITGGLWLGLVDDAMGMFQDRRIAMNTNDVMLLFTDGITELPTKDGGMLGTDKLIEWFREAVQSNARSEQMLEYIIHKIDLDAREDDITLMILKNVDYNLDTG